jgi:hypothetical protein
MQVIRLNCIVTVETGDRQCDKHHGNVPLFTRERNFLLNQRLLTMNSCLSKAFPCLNTSICIMFLLPRKRFLKFPASFASHSDILTRRLRHIYLAGTMRTLYLAYKRRSCLTGLFQVFDIFSEGKNFSCSSSLFVCSMKESDKRQLYSSETHVITRLQKFVYHSGRFDCLQTRAFLTLWENMFVSIIVNMR